MSRLIQGHELELAVAMGKVLGNLEEHTAVATEMLSRRCEHLGKWYVIRITHFSMYFKTFAGSLGSCLNTRPKGRVFKLLPRDPANVNALKQTYDRYSCILYDSMKTPVKDD